MNFFYRFRLAISRSQSSYSNDSEFCNGKIWLVSSFATLVLAKLQFQILPTIHFGESTVVGKDFISRLDV